jgi:hypothetical protein
MRAAGAMSESFGIRYKAKTKGDGQPAPFFYGLSPSFSLGSREAAEQGRSNPSSVKHPHLG